MTQPLPASAQPYAAAGVDLGRAEAVVDIAKRAAAATPKAGVLGGIGGFSGAFELPPGIRQPVLLAACDGVGTKLKLAADLKRFDTVGIDLVAMNVNDLLASGGRPLVFLDYLATSTLELPVVDALLTGIAEGCRQSDCALLGGETAEMPGMYAPGDVDVAGFCVGVAEKAELLPRLGDIIAGTKLIGLASSGIHSNGYSLVRKLAEGADLTRPEPAIDPSRTLGDVLLTPTRIYVKPIRALCDALPGAVLGMVHVTGGGFTDNLPRVLPEGIGARIDRNTWTVPPVFTWLQQRGNLTDDAMAHTFNLGIGMILLVPPSQADAVCQHLAASDPALAPRVIGELLPWAEGDTPRVNLV